ncbi:MAG: LPXTG cell wall anchor domain-containing protein [Acidimicrobiales bacterium]
MCLTATIAGPSPAGAQTAEGVGTSKASHTLISLQLGNAGSLLDLGVLADTAQSTIDVAQEPAHAVSRLVPVSLASGVLPGLSNLVSALPTFESRTPGGNPNVSGSALDLGAPSGLLGLPLGLLGGSVIPTSLTSALDADGARSGLDAKLLDLSLVSGLLKVVSVNNKMGTAAALPAANGTRNLGIDAISLLDLGDLLAGLNLDLAELPLGVISDLVSTLNLPVALPTGAADLESAVDGLLATITGILGQVAGDEALLSSIVGDVPAINGLLGNLPVALPLNGLNLTDISTLDLPLGTVSGLLTTLQDTLTNLLGTVLGLLDDLTLLKLDGATIGATTKATDSLATSVADVTGKLGGISVLGIQLPGVDLLSIGELVNGVTSTLGNVLSVIDPSLKDLIHVGVLEKATSLTTANGYNQALAGIDVLNVKITPPAILQNLVGTLTGNTGLSSLGMLSAAGVANPLGELPLLGSGALGLGNLLNLPETVGALTQGLTLKVGSVQSASQFKLAAAPAPAVAAAPVPVAELPRTGGDTRTLGLLAAGMALLALGVRRWARRPEMD